MSVLLGSAPFINSPNQTTVNLNYLSVAMGGIDPITGVETTRALRQSFGTASNGTWIDGYPPFASDVQQPLLSNPTYGSYTFGSYTTTLTAGHLANNYLNDYYFRIWVDVTNLALGNVLSAQVKYINIWNSYLTSKVLTSISLVSLPDVTITSGLTLPYTFTPLMYKTITVGIPTSGQPAISGTIAYNFSGTNIPITTVTGQRVLFWPFNSISTFKESREYATDIIKALGSEQRFSIRPIPRLTLDYNYIYKDNAEFTSAKLLGKRVANSALAQALWTEAIKLTNLTAGQTIITVATANFEYTIGTTIVFWKSYLIWEIGTIASLTTTTITLQQALQASYTSCWLAPIYIGYTSSGIQINSDEGYSKTGSISMTCHSPYYGAINPFTFTLQSLPIFDFPIVVTGGLPNNYTRNQESIEVISGDVLRFDTENYTREATAITIFAPDRLTVNKYRRMFDYFQGRFNLFFFPSNQKDGSPLTTLIVGTDSIKVVNNQFTTSTIGYVRVIGTDGTGTGQVQESFQVSGVTDNGDGTETIGFVVAATKIISTVTQVQILIKARFDSDTINFQYQTRNKCLVNVTILEVLA